MGNGGGDDDDIEKEDEKKIAYTRMIWGFFFFRFASKLYSNCIRDILGCYFSYFIFTFFFYFSFASVEFCMLFATTLALISLGYTYVQCTHTPHTI